jgi:hypothetical protein
MPWEKIGGIAPALLGAFQLETLESTGPFGAGFGHIPQLGRGSEPAGFDVFGTLNPLHVVRGGNLSARQRPRIQALDEIGHAVTDQMGFQALIFKPGAGGGEV